MAIETKNLGPINAYQKLDELQTTKHQKHQQTEQSSEKATGVTNALDRVSANIEKMNMRTEQQASLVAHLFGDGASTQQSSLKITYQAAIEKINEILMAQMPSAESNDATVKPISEEALQAQGGMEYWTPENTAKRIVNGATAFFDGFKAAHPELEGEELINQFIEVVGGGLTQGFDEAKGILGDLDVLKGEIAENIELTFQLVQSGMETFRQQFLNPVTEIIESTEAPLQTTEVDNQTTNTAENRTDNS